MGASITLQKRLKTATFPLKEEVTFKDKEPEANLLSAVVILHTALHGKSVADYYLRKIEAVDYILLAHARMVVLDKADASPLKGNKDVAEMCQSLTDHIIAYVNIEGPDEFRLEPSEDDPNVLNWVPSQTQDAHDWRSML